MIAATVSAELLIFLQPNLIDGTSSQAGVFCVKLDCCFQGQDHSEGSKLY